jgi:hypothetical protein
MKLLNIWISSFNKCCVTKILDGTDDDILCDNSYFDNHNLKRDLEYSVDRDCATGCTRE